MPRLGSDYDITADDIREALRLPDSFCADDERLGVTWGLGPTLETRDSGYRTRATAKDLLDHLNSDPSLEKDWYVLRASHWGCGWCEQIAYKVLEHEPTTYRYQEEELEAAETHLSELNRFNETTAEPVDIIDAQNYVLKCTKKLNELKGPSRIFRVLMQWQRDQQDCGEDSETVGIFRQEEVEDYIRNNLDRGTRDDLPEDWVEQMSEELDRRGYIQDEPSGDIFISRDHAAEVIEALGFKEAEDVEETDPTGSR